MKNINDKEYERYKKKKEKILAKINILNGDLKKVNQVMEKYDQAYKELEKLEKKKELILDQLRTNTLNSDS